MLNDFIKGIKDEIEELKLQGLYKNEYSITSDQSTNIEIELASQKKKVINFCANNYLGLANNKTLEEAAKKAIDQYGIGTASVRFICGTMTVHREFEQKIANFLGYEDAISYSSCFAANGGVFAALFTESDAIISADLNHASLIDGIRLCKSKKYFYKFDDMQDLEEKLKQAQGEKFRLIVTDGVFSMDGDIAKLNEICDLAEKYNSFVMVDDSHATGFVGKTGRGTIELAGVKDRVLIVSSTLGKALGGGGGGFVVSKKEIIEKLRNKSRPYLFSNNIIPAIAASSIKALEMIDESRDLIAKLQENTAYFRSKMLEAGFDVRAGEHPIAPVMIYDAALAAKMAKGLIEEEGIYVIAFSFPVVPKGEARIRVQLSSLHTREQLDKAIAAFIKQGKKCGIIK